MFAMMGKGNFVEQFSFRPVIFDRRDIDVENLSMVYHKKKLSMGENLNFGSITYSV